MCGIAGKCSRGPKTELQDEALMSLGHRGPDASGAAVWAGDRSSWALGHTRLAIQDLSPAGEQPIYNRDRSLVMVFNGEIYNYPELRAECEAAGHRFSSTMDGEVVLHLWEAEGPDALDRLNGIFAVAVGDTRTGELVLARDPLGVKPLFYARQEDGALAFASEIAALRALGVGGGGDDLVALAQFLSFLWIPDPRTPHTDVRSLEPGQALSWSASGVRTFAYGEPFMPAPADGTDADARELGERFRAASRRQLLSDVPIGLMASGGVDSGLIQWATHDAIVRCFTIIWPGEAGREALEQDEAAVRDLERRFAVPVSYIGGATAEDDLLPSSGDLFADPAHGLTRLIARTARERGLKVLLSGQGGDELFGGYRRHSVAPILARVRLGAAGRWVERAVQRLPLQRVGSEYAARLLRALSEGDAFSAYMQLCTYSTAAERAAALDCTEAEVADEVVWQRHREVFDRIPAETSLLRKFMALDLHVYLPGLGLAYVDRAGMEFGVEVRVPWLDLEFVRWTLSLPDEAIVRKGRGKWLPRSLAADVLDPNIANRPKRGFAAPAERVSAAADTSGARGFRQGAYFGRAKKLLDAHLAGGAGGLRPDPRAAA